MQHGRSIDNEKDVTNNVPKTMMKPTKDSRMYQCDAYDLRMLCVRLKMYVYATKCNVKDSYMCI